jgi:hypothetical protein
MSEWVAGLDLGQSQDYTALALLQAEEVPDESAPPREGRPDERPLVRRYSVRHLHRWALGSKYAQIANDLGALLTDPPQPPPPHPSLTLAGCDVVYDETGVGKGVGKLLSGAGLPAKLRPVLITAGHHENYSDGAWCVPKKQLVSVLQVLLQGRRLLVGKGLSLAEVLSKELAAFKVNVTAAGNESFEAWRERDHDDLVLAVALACWWAETHGTQTSALPMSLKPTPADLQRLAAKGVPLARYGRPG